MQDYNNAFLKADKKFEKAVYVFYKEQMTPLQ